MKYFIGRIEERNGEREYAYDYLIKAKDEDEAWDKLNKLAQYWYGQEGTLDKDSDGHGFWSGSIYCEAYDVSPTTKGAFIKNFLRAYTI